MFNRADGWIDCPLDLPCGQCIGCRLARAEEWAIRIMHESKLHKANSFVTLTYSDENLPDPPSLNTDDMTRFWKRLRKKVGKLRYYYCGEYGERTKRPHYHACLFGHDFESDRELHQVTRAGDKLYTSPTLTEAWGLGHALVGELTPWSAGYVSRYIMKKKTGELGHLEYELVNAETGEVAQAKPPFVSMSRKPGIGQGWFDKYHPEVFPHDAVYFKGRLARVPRYYTEQLTQEEQDQVKARRRAKAEKHNRDLTPERLEVRENCAINRTKLLKRNLD